MKLAILTFQFAHNYGALLQAYALRDYLVKLGNDVQITPYYPQWAQKEYAFSPLTTGLTMKKRIKLTIQYKKRKKLAHVFTQFQKRFLHLKDSFETVEELEKYLNQFDIVVFGSDQIWNNSITGDTDAYYGAGISCSRVSYAASLGTKTLTSVQEKHIKKYLPCFRYISVRETQSQLLLQQYVDKDVCTVTDPVFLLDYTEWIKICKPVSIKDKFMLVYFLKDDMLLLNYAYEYAKQYGLKIYEVHPTLAKFHNGCIPLYDIGPCEFLWLIKNAECICTNSFHATSFSLIFKKKLLHIPNSISPERTMTLLRYLGIDIKERIENEPLYDFSLYNYDELNSVINKSKDFLQKMNNL